MRLWLTVFFCAAIGTAAAAQAIMSNSPRDRRDLQVSPPPPQPLPGQLTETIDQSRWGTLSKPLGQPAWGTFGPPAGR